MNDIKTAQDNSQKAIAMLKEAILAVLQPATESGEGIGPSAIRNKLEIQEESLPKPPSNTKWGTTQIVYILLHLLEKDGLAQRSSLDAKKWVLSVNKSPV